MMRSPALFLVVLVLVLAADQKFCPKERQGDKCKAKQLRRQVFIPFPIQTSLQVCLQVRCLLQRPLSQRSPGLARGSSWGCGEILWETNKVWILLEKRCELARKAPPTTTSWTSLAATSTDRATRTTTAEALALSPMPGMSLLPATTATLRYQHEC